MANLVLLGNEPANDGEKIVVQHLQNILPKSYTLFPNIEIFQKGSLPYEYDVVVLAPHGIYVVEIKYWRGGIKGDDHSWRVAGQHNRPNPFSTANNKARVLKSRINHELPALAGNFWVQAIVVIADDKGGLNINGSSKKWVCQYPDAPKLIMDDGRIRSRDLTPFRRNIEDGIKKFAQGRRLGSLKVGDYEVLETLQRRDEVTEYLAKHALISYQQSLRLRVFSYNPYLADEDLAKRQERIKREAEALQRIGTHPNLINVRSFATDPNDPNLFFSVTDWSEEGTLRDLMNSEVPLSLERKLELAHGIVAGLTAAHKADVIHRDIRPENILISKSGQPILMNFDYARIAITGTQTVGPVELDPDVPRAYMAPELLNPTLEPTEATDIYSVGVILFELLTNVLLFETPEDALKQNTSGGGPSELAGIDIPDQLNELVRMMMKPSQADRIQSSEAVLQEIVAIQDTPSSSIAPEPESKPPQKAPDDREPHEFVVGDIIGGKFQVQKKLPAGGFGQVYQVYDERWERKFALKIFTRGNQDLEREFSALRDIQHKYIAKVFDWNILPNSKRVYLISEFVEGDALTQFTKPEKRLSVKEAVGCIIELLEALQFIHPDIDRLEELRAIQDAEGFTEEQYEEFRTLQNEGWYHRDIKPANLILSPDGIKLIDFNIARKASEAGITYTGTQGYMLPDIGMRRWDTDDDLFAVGIVLYELITGHHPYHDRQPSFDSEPTDPTDYINHLHENLVEILLKATSCKSDTRYRSAASFREDLLDLNGMYLRAISEPIDTSVEIELLDWEEGKENYNPYVTRMLTLYSQARRDNSGTRGLADISKLTYVKTRLDTYLQPTVLDGQYRLVIITGNAGDGKTAFIKNLEQVAENDGAMITFPTQNSSRFVYRDIEFHTNYDGSQDEGDERANDLVLTEFFQNFSDAEIEEHLEKPSVHIIAINKGRILDFFTDQTVASEFRELADTITGYFEAENIFEIPEWITIVDLNQRSVVASDSALNNESIFARQLEQFLQPKFWAPCETCALQNDCFIKFNADSLSDQVSGYSVRKRIETLFEIVHLRRKLHITMRDMRSAMSWLIFRDHSCEDVNDLLSELDSSKDYSTVASLLYHNAFAMDSNLPVGSNDDRLVRLLRQIDPAEVSNPATDRDLNFKSLSKLNLFTFENRSDIPFVIFDNWSLPRGWEASQNAANLRQHIRKHSMLRRLLYFERRDEGWVQMLPYSQLERFKTITSRSEFEIDDDELKTLIITGISMAEGAKNVDYASQYVVLSTDRDRFVKIKTFRLFPRDDFEISLPVTSDYKFIEYSADQIVFSHDPKDPSLRVESANPAQLMISLDLLEMLDQIMRGFVPSQDDLSGVFVNLTIFKNSLAHLPFRHLLLTRDDRNFYQIMHSGIDTLKIEKLD